MVNHDFEGMIVAGTRISNVKRKRKKNFERKEKKKEELCVQAMVCLNSTKTNINIYTLLHMTMYIYTRS